MCFCPGYDYWLFEMGALWVVNLQNGSLLHALLQCVWGWLGQTRFFLSANEHERQPFYFPR